MIQNKHLSKKTKMMIYKTIIRPIITYAGETITMTKKNEEELRIMERKIIRTIAGPIKINENEHRTRMNHELLQEITGRK